MTEPIVTGIFREKFDCTIISLPFHVIGFLIDESKLINGSSNFWRILCIMVITSLRCQIELQPKSTQCMYRVNQLAYTKSTKRDNL